MRFPYGERLRAELGPAHHPIRLTSSPRSNVWRARLDGSGAEIVVKQIVGGPDASARYDREVTALRLAARTGVTPTLLGTDGDTLTLVLEHLTDEGPAEDWVVAYAEGLARLHAAASSETSLPCWTGPGDGDVRAFLGFAGMLGVASDAKVTAELADLVSRLADQPGDALLHGDPCPGNDLYVAGEVRFVDLEQASVGAGLTELAYLRVGFPTCWCVTEVAEPLLTRAEAAYRRTWRAERGTDPAGDLTDACTGWLIRGDALVERAHRETVDHLARAYENDWPWGTITARRRLAHRLGVVATLTADRDDLAAVSELTSRMRTRMLTLWPDLDPPPRHRP